MTYFIDRSCTKILCLVLGILYIGLGLISLLMVIVSIVDAILGAYINGIWDTFLFFSFTLLFFFAGMQGILIFTNRNEPNLKSQIRRGFFFVVTIIVILVVLGIHYIVYFGFSCAGIGLFIIPGLNHDVDLSLGTNISLSIVFLILSFCCVCCCCCFYLGIGCLNFFSEKEYAKAFGSDQSVIKYFRDDYVNQTNDYSNPNNQGAGFNYKKNAENIRNIKITYEMDPSIQYGSASTEYKIAKPQAEIISVSQNNASINNINSISNENQQNVSVVSKYSNNNDNITEESITQPIEEDDEVNYSGGYQDL